MKVKCKKCGYEWKMQEENIKCNNCGYEWVTKSKAVYVSCPSCLKKVKNGGKDEKEGDTK